MPPPFENEKTIIESQAGQHRSTVPSSEKPNHLRDSLTRARDLRLRAEREATLALDYHTASFLQESEASLDVGSAIGLYLSMIEPLHAPTVY